MKTIASPPPLCTQTNPLPSSPAGYRRGLWHVHGRGSGGLQCFPLTGERGVERKREGRHSAISTILNSHMTNCEGGEDRKNGISWPHGMRKSKRDLYILFCLGEMLSFYVVLQTRKDPSWLSSWLILLMGKTHAPMTWKTVWLPQMVARDLHHQDQWWKHLRYIKMSAVGLHF